MPNHQPQQMVHVESLAKYFTEVRKALNSFRKLLTVMAGGALTLSIGFILKESEKPFPHQLLPDLKMAWTALSICLIASLIEAFFTLVGMAQQANYWEQYLANNAPYRKVVWAERIGWAALLLAFLTCALGIFKLMQITLSLITLRAG
jgi:hypothetical protein